ncbi:MAG: hypothetical protein FD152_1721 [Xanthobacteraceae bacterium]|nr:MAG: hypothetical protein FD152_1721 [Xanthobacteraceae bacterium]
MAPRQPRRNRGAPPAGGAGRGIPGLVCRRREERGSTVRVLATAWGAFGGAQAIPVGRLSSSALVLPGLALSYLRGERRHSRDLPFGSHFAMDSPRLNGLFTLIFDI